MFNPNNPYKDKYEKRREIWFLIFTGVFLGSLTMLNILGISRFIDLSFTFLGVRVPFQFAAGVLAYPITFLCTDFISEIYGKKRANTIVIIGLVLNFWVLAVMGLGANLPPTDHVVNLTINYHEFDKSFMFINKIVTKYPEITQYNLHNGIQYIDSLLLNNPAMQNVEFHNSIQRIDTIVSLFPEFQVMNFKEGINSIENVAKLNDGISYTNLPPIPNISNYQSSDWAFFRMKQLTFGAVVASMIAYLTAQLVDVQIFHYLKKLTKGKHLWLRNNGSTIVSQLVDSFAVTLITYYYAHALPVVQSEAIFPQIITFALSAFVFKLAWALFDTIPFVYGTRFFAKHLNIKMDYLEKK